MYVLFVVTLSFIGVCQDIILKKDSTKIIAKTLKITDSEITYLLFNYQNEPELKIKKSDVFKIIFRNGTEIVFNSSNIGHQSDTSIIITVKKFRKVKDTLKIGNYIKFNVQLGAVINSSDCNRRYNDQDKNLYKFGGEYYWITSKPHINANINVGCNFIFGASPYIKHVVGIHYLRSKGEFNYEKSSVSISGNYIASSYYKKVNYRTKVDFINIVSGLRFRVLKNIYIEPLLGLNIVVNASNTLNGFEEHESYGVVTEKKTYKNEKSNELPDRPSTVSICPRLSYEFKVKQQALGVYFSYNLSYRVNLPWFMAGLTCYPFKKLR